MPASVEKEIAEFWRILSLRGYGRLAYDEQIQKVIQAVQRPLQQEIERLTACLAAANSGFEEYERKFYLAQDRAEQAEAEIQAIREKESRG